jgi:phosphatidylglycerophosphate synthase
MLVVTAVAGGTGLLWPVAVTGGALLGGLVLLGRDQWTPAGAFGPANTVTALRVGAMGLLPLMAGEPAWVFTVSVGILAADALDGWLARRDDSASAFGAFFDKEADALFVLLLAAVAVHQGRVPLAVVGAGLLRYGFVVAVFGWDLPTKTEARSSLARYVYGAMVGTLLFSFLPFPALARPLASLATLALAASFARSLWQMWPQMSPVRNGG